MLFTSSPSKGGRGAVIRKLVREPYVIPFPNHYCQAVIAAETVFTHANKYWVGWVYLSPTKKG